VSAGASDQEHGAGRTWLIGPKADRYLLWLSVVVFVATYAYFYPKIYTTKDEQAYLAMASVLKHGHLTLNSLHQNVVMSFPFKGRLVAFYPPGMGATIAVVSLFGWTAALGTNFIVLLVGFAVVVKFLRDLKLPALFGVLYLLDPANVLFSRTVLSDLLSGVLITLGLLALLHDRTRLAGLALGATVLVRNADGLALATTALGMLWEIRRVTPAGERVREMVKWVAKFLQGAILPVVLALLAYFAVGGGSALSHTGTFSLHYLHQDLPWLLVDLLVIYPGMLLAPLFFQSRIRWPLILTAYGYIALYSLWSYQDRGTNTFETLIVSQRFLLSVLPLFILSYAALAMRLFDRLKNSTLITAKYALSVLAVIALMGACVLVQHQDQSHLSQLKRARTGLLSIVSPNDLLICDTEVGKLFLPMWGRRSIEIVQTDGNAAEVDSILQSWLADPAHSGDRAFIADWIDGGVSAEIGGGEETAGIELLEQQLSTRSLSSELTRGLPAGLVIRRVTHS
jgi:hypothetical protein